MPTHLHESGDYQYAPLVRLASFNSAGTGSIRVTLYTWDDTNNNWASADTILVSDLTGFGTTEYEPATWLSLPSEYSGFMVSGIILVGVQLSASGIVQVATKGNNSVLDGGIDGPSMLLNASGVTHQSTISHPVTGFIQRTGYSLYRRPPAA